MTKAVAAPKKRRKFGRLIKPGFLLYAPAPGTGPAGRTEPAKWGNIKTKTPQDQPELDMPHTHHNGAMTGGKPLAAKTRAARIPDGGGQRGRLRPAALVALSLAALPLLGSCGATRSVAPDATQIDGFHAGVVADDPRAALIGRTVIANGGNAADGAVAAYFAMAVTMPSAAGLGGGGICIAHDGDEVKTDVIDFLPRAAAAGAVAVPGNVRGMAALNARYGKLPLSALIGLGMKVAVLP